MRSNELGWVYVQSRQYAFYLLTLSGGISEDTSETVQTQLPNVKPRDNPDFSDPFNGDSHGVVVKKVH